MRLDNLRFAKTHEWVAVDGDVATIGISDFAVKLLTDIVYLSLPAVGKKFSPGESIGEIESVKAVSEIYAPVQGEVTAINEAKIRTVAGSIATTTRCQAVGLTVSRARSRSARVQSSPPVSVPHSPRKMRR